MCITTYVYLGGRGWVPKHQLRHDHKWQCFFVGCPCHTLGTNHSLLLAVSTQWFCYLSPALHDNGWGVSDVILQAIHLCSDTKYPTKPCQALSFIIVARKTLPTWRSSTNTQFYRFCGNYKGICRNLHTDIIFYVHPRNMWSSACRHHFPAAPRFTSRMD